MKEISKETYLNYHANAIGRYLSLDPPIVNKWNITEITPVYFSDEERERPGLSVTFESKYFTGTLVIVINRLDLYNIYRLDTEDPQKSTLILKDVYGFALTRKISCFFKIPF